MLRSVDVQLAARWPRPAPRPAAAASGPGWPRSRPAAAGPRAAARRAATPTTPPTSGGGRWLVVGHREAPPGAGRASPGRAAARSPRFESRADAESSGTFGRRERRTRPAIVSCRSRHAGSDHPMGRTTWSSTAALSASTPEQVSALLTAAGQAPSLHNSQPWRFRLRPRIDRAARRPRPAAAGRRSGRAGASPGLWRRPVQPAAGPARPGHPPNRHDLSRTRRSRPCSRPSGTADTSHPRHTSCGCCRPSRPGGPTAAPSTTSRSPEPSSARCGRPLWRRVPGCS